MNLEGHAPQLCICVCVCAGESVCVVFLLVLTSCCQGSLELLETRVLSRHPLRWAPETCSMVCIVIWNFAIGLWKN